jgi:hypothetical protein
MDTHQASGREDGYRQDNHGYPMQGTISRQHIIIQLIILSWVWSICLALPPLLGWGQYRPEANGMR